MRIRFVVVGKTKSPHWAALAEDYVKRTARFAPCETTIVREADAALASDARRALEREAHAIAQAIPADAISVLLDVDGEMTASEELAERIRRWRDAGERELCVVVGGHWGVAESVRRRADWRWSLSRLTFTHEMARTLATEQIYRAFTILHRFPYAK